MPYNLTDLFVRLSVLLIAFPAHELAHAWTAYLLGDDTPLRDGRLTWRPWAHLDLMGALLFLLTGFGWAKPVRFIPARVRQRHRYGVLWVTLAGPAVHGLFALLAVLGLAVTLRLGWRGVSTGLYLFAFVNLILLFFNLLPLPPLDGARVLEELVPAWRRYYARLQPYALGIFLILLWLAPRFGLPVLTWLVVRPAAWVLDLLVRSLPL